MPRLAHVRVRMSLQENLLQLVHGKVGEMHLLLPAHRDRPADRLFRNLRRTHSLPWRRALRCRPDQGSCVGRGSEGSTPPSSASSSILMTPRCRPPPGAMAYLKERQSVDEGKSE